MPTEPQTVELAPLVTLVAKRPKGAKAPKAGTQYLILQNGPPRVANSGDAVDLEPSARVYELRLVPEFAGDEPYGPCRGGKTCVPVILPPPSLNAVPSAWVWCPKPRATRS